MLFHSVEFLFLFLPATAAVLFALNTMGHQRLAMWWIVAASVFFYGYWNVAYLPLLVGSVALNYCIGERLGATKDKRLLILGIAVNLGLLAYFKYAGFIADNLRFLGVTDLRVVLPIGISFLTFEQIAYLVDTFRGQTPRREFLRYACFIAFFPRLIAGPIVRAQEMMPQLRARALGSLDARSLATGATIFIIGLFKKVICADHVGSYATHVFQAADAGTAVTLFEAWGGALAFTCQIYFDFSGYSDMAIGIARIFGIVLPMNFDSPYKAHNIIEFWRRWHMTLSRFLRDYLYIPLGGDRKGEARRNLNLMLTMLVAGLWHGAGWTYVAWGGIHGFYLCVNHGWRALRRRWGHVTTDATLWGRRCGTAATLCAVVVAWVFFRATSFAGALNVLTGMAGLHGLGGISTSLVGYCVAPLLLLVCLLAPNTQELVGRMDAVPAGLTFAAWTPAPAWWRWKPSPGWSIALGLMFYIAMISLTEEREFIYFRF